MNGIHDFQEEQHIGRTVQNDDANNAENNPAVVVVEEGFDNGKPTTIQSGDPQQPEPVGVGQEPSNMDDNASIQHSQGSKDEEDEEDEDEETRLQWMFDQVAEWIRSQAPSSSNSSRISIADQLRLYGWYKHVTVGPCPLDDHNNIPSAWLQPTAHAKYQAWKACRHDTRQSALQAYLDLATAHSPALQDHVQALQLQYQKQQRRNPSQSNKNKNRQEMDPGRGTNGSALKKNDETRIQSFKKITNKQKDDPTNTVGMETVKGPSTLASSSKGPVSLSSFETTTRSSRGLIPRGQLDISYADLAWTAHQCLTRIMSPQGCPSQRHQLTQDIGRAWNHLDSSNKNNHDNTKSESIVVGRSVRSLWDLYLVARQFPPGSQVIITPPITVPGMLAILEHHQVQAVGVDFATSTTTTTTTTLPQHPLQVDCAALEACVTDRTVAILVVHVFGVVTECDWSTVRSMATAHSLDVVEDCAQVYSGHGGYTGSPHADMSLFSFGFIKTATALGGGLAVVRQHVKTHDDDNHTKKPPVDSLGQQMNRLQDSSTLYRQQSSTSYLLRSVLPALGIRLVTQHPVVYQWSVWWVVHVLGYELDAVARSMVRGFSSSSGSNRQFVQQVRCQPCVPLMALLLRRLQQASQTRDLVQMRRTCGLDVIQRLPPSSVPIRYPAVPKKEEANASSPTFWLLPIRYPQHQPPMENKSNTITVEDWIRFHHGWDVSRSASQLVSVPGCPQAHAWMQDLLYLPITSSSSLALPQERSNLCAALEAASTTFASNQGATLSHTPYVSRMQRHWYQASLGLMAVVMWYTRSVVRTCLPVVLAMVVCGALFVWFIVWSMADFYLHHSHAFAQYCGLITSRHEKETNPGASKGDSHHETEDPPPVIEALRCLQLPSRDNDDNDPKRTVFVTGVTGFIGSMLLYDLIQHYRELGLDKIIVLCRAKKGEGASRRIRTLLSQPLFSSLTATEESLANLLQVMEGDVTLPGLGLTNSDQRRLLTDTSITHVFHCAAAVHFTQPLEQAARCNISAPLELQQLTARMAHPNVTFVHLSTAFVHGSQTGSRSKPLPEKLFSLEPYHASEVYQSMLGSQYLASKCYQESGFPNTYTFSKCVCEHLLTQSSVKTVIVRPSIVGPAVQYPFEGWSGKKPSTFVAAACLYLNFQWNLWYFGPQIVPCIPVDVLSRFILKKAFERRNHERQNGYHHSPGGLTNGAKRHLEDTNSNGPLIYNATWDVASPSSALFSWLDFAVAVTQLGAFMGYFSRLTACIGLFVTTRVMPRLNPGIELYRLLHSWLVIGPFTLAIHAAEWIGLDCTKTRRVLPFLDLPVLFLSFSTTSYYFSSELVAPSEFVGDRYAFQSALAAHKFSVKLKKDQSGDRSVERKVIAGRRKHSSWFSDLLWAFGQPRGRLPERFAAWFLSILLRRVCSEVTVDVSSFATHLRETLPAAKRRLLLAPTHRSFFDFLLVSFICFSVPELQIDLPVIAAAFEFSTLPIFAWIIPLFRMFYVFRGRGKTGVDQASKELAECLSNESVVMEVYIEGTRSRDRRFVSPKTGLIRQIQATDPSCVILPITINYERIAEQEALSSELRDGAGHGLNLSGLGSWLRVSNMLRIVFETRNLCTEWNLTFLALFTSASSSWRSFTWTNPHCRSAHLAGWRECERFRGSRSSRSSEATAGFIGGFFVPHCCRCKTLFPFRTDHRNLS